jgi:hypothetical protein
MFGHVTEAFFIAANDLGLLPDAAAQQDDPKDRGDGEQYDDGHGEQGVARCPPRGLAQDGYILGRTEQEPDGLRSDSTF